ncbi:MAG: gliding motility-associated protein GldE [Paludibacteraceae bacterium]|nr:gliding motility-associated protein GldE [Paludibacteraceae bacterium]
MEVPLLLFVGLILLLACSAFTSASEIAFFALSLNDLEELKKSNKKNDKIILQLREKPDYLLSTLLIFNNLVNVSVVIVASELLYCILGVNLDEVIKFLIDTVLITFVVLLFGENMPKIYASSNPLQFARKAAFPLSILSKILYPISWLLVKPTSRVKRLEKHANTSVSMDELSQAFELTSNEIKEDKEILEGIIKFGNINTVGAMTPRVDVVAISDTASFKEVIDLIINAGYSRIPVYQENIDEIRGILYVKDLLPHIDKPDFDWRTLIRKPFFVPQTKHINTLLEEFQQNKTHIAVVVDEFGGTAGIITMEDILEEIVGEITDEYDEDEGRMYVQINENTYLFEAKILLNDFFKIKGIQRADFEDSIGEAETLAGLILELKGEIPDQEAEIDFKQYKFTIVSSDKRRIKSIKLSIENQQLEKDK